MGVVGLSCRLIFFSKMHVRDSHRSPGKNGSTKMTKMKLSDIDADWSETRVGVVSLLSGLIFFCKMHVRDSHRSPGKKW